MTPTTVQTVYHCKQHNATFVKSIVFSSFGETVSKRSQLSFYLLGSVRLACCGVVFDFIGG